MYSIINDVAYINGSEGKYDKQINNKYVRYGRNACDNYKKYITDIPDGNAPLEYEYRYTPNGNINRYALLGNAYEELGKRAKVKTEELNKKLCVIENASADALDLNKDGYVDIAEYSTDILAQDILSSDESYHISPEKADGVINNTGEIKSIALLNKNKQKMAGQIYQNLYNDFSLETAKKEFLADPTNLK